MRRFKDSFLKDKKFWKETLIIILFGIIINAACFLMPLVVHAEPYESDYFPINSGYNPSNYPIDNEYITGLFTDPTVCMVKVYWENSVSHPDWYTIYVLHDSSVTSATPFFLYGEVYTSNPSRFDVRSSSNISGIYVESYQYRDGAWSDLLNRWDNSFAYFTNTSSTIADPRTIYFVKENLNKDNATGLTLIFGMVKEVISPGEFTDLPGLDEILNNIQNNWQPPSSITGHALPSQPTENPNNNDFQNRLQMFDYLKDSINAIIGNLGYNLKNWFDNLIGKMVEGFNSVSQNVWNGFKTLMDNIKDFFGPKIDAIIDKFNYITEEPDSEQIIDFIETTSIYSDISSINSSVTTFGSSFTGVSEPDDYTITFHIEDIDILNQSDPFVLHLNILNPIKSTLRAFLWVIVSYGLFISVIDSLPNYINGGGGEDD